VGYLGPSGDILAHLGATWAHIGDILLHLGADESMTIIDYAMVCCLFQFLQTVAMLGASWA
jgi:hypothetical protein